MPLKRPPQFRHLTLAQEVKRLEQLEKEGKEQRTRGVEYCLPLTTSKRTRGRPKKGTLSLGPEGKILRVIDHYVPAHAIENPRLRGKAAKAWDFICILKERAPLVYVYLLDELSKPARSRELRLQIIEQELQREYPSRFKVPPKKLLAYIMERAFHGMWEKYGIAAPYSGGNHEAFYTGYVYGHAGAIRAYRKILREPKPWPPEHVGHDLKFYLGNRGDAVCLRYPRLLKGNDGWCVLDIVEGE